MAGLMDFSKLIAAVLLAASIVIARSEASAELGATAKPGDTCSPVNGLAVGLEVPVGGQIVDERVVLVGGWRLFAWALLDSKGQWWLAPSRSFGTDVPPNFGGAVISLARPDHDSIVQSYDEYVKTYPNVAPVRANLDGMLIAPCFAKPWGGPFLVRDAR